MENEDTKVDGVEETEVEDEVLAEDEVDNDDVDWKAEAIKARGIAKRAQTKLAKLGGKETKAVTVQEEKTEKKDFDLNEKAFLKASGISASEFEFVKNLADETGKKVDDLVETKYFQAELKEFRESQAVKSATPRGTGRSGQSARDSVEYWIAKGELPPADQQELRRKVVEARIKNETSGSKFTQRPVA
jgi:hypothetical protein